MEPDAGGERRSEKLPVAYKAFDSTQILGRWNRSADENDVTIIREMRIDREFN
jgi:hypothetical protein